MSNVVVDASIASAWLIPDEQSEATDAVLHDLPHLKAFVPTLFRHEVRNVILLALRRGRIDSDKATALLQKLRGLPLDEIGVDDDAHIISLAVHHKLTAYDAAYLSLAVKTGSSLATLDAKLASAARQLHIGLLGPLAP